MIYPILVGLFLGAFGGTIGAALYIEACRRADERRKNLPAHNQACCKRRCGFHAITPASPFLPDSPRYGLRDELLRKLIPRIPK